jgi:hypothetical protein
MLLLRASRHVLPVWISAPRRSTSARLFTTTTKKPEWMVQAEQEAIAATNARAAKQGTANDVAMSRFKHEIGSEQISNTVKLQDKLNQLIQKANELKSGATDQKGRMVYTAVRKKALALRQDLITQREAAGMATDATSAVEAAFPIPASV